MRLVVDLQPMQGPSAERGIGYYAISLARALGATREDHEIFVLLDGQRSTQDVLRVRHRLSPHVPRDKVVLFEGPPLDHRDWDRPDAEIAREATLAALRPEAVLLTGVFELPDGAPLSVSEWSSETFTAAVLYDLIPLSDLDHYKPGAVQRRDYLVGVDRLGQMDVLLTISEHTGAEARRMLRSCPPTVTIYGAAPDPSSARRPPNELSDGFALAVGRDEPRKDVGTAVLAWAALSPEVRGNRLFVIVGEWPRESQLALTRRSVAAGLAPSALIFAGQVHDHELAWLYQHAEVLVFPSLSEGLGLPPLEAMKVGTPVLMAATTSLVELLDEPRAYFPAGDVGALTERMHDLLTDAQLRDDLVAAGHKSAARFTWEETARRTWAALEERAPRTSSTARLRLGVVAEKSPVPSVVPAFAASYEVTEHDAAALLNDWVRTWASYDRVLYVLPPQGCWESFTDALADAPGVVLAPSGMPRDVDLSTFLAPAVAVIVPDAATSTALLRAGVVGVPIFIVEDADGVALAAAIEEAYTSDVGRHWASGAAMAPSEVDGRSVERRPPWSARGRRGPLLASDVTLYRATPFMSGIQRTAHRLHSALSEILAERGGAVVPVHLGTPPEGVAHPDIRRDDVLAAERVMPGDPDWILGIDLNAQVMHSAPAVLPARARGVGLAINVFDLIPYTHPHWYPAGAAASSFTPWLQEAVRMADVLLVNSRATATDLEKYIARAPPKRPDGFVVHLLPLGCDFDQAPDVEPPERDRTHFLVVGTIEPRKGHSEVLDAFERLWIAGNNSKLTVVGRAGWMVDDLVRRMEALQGRQPLFRWLRNASDLELDRLYRQCTAAIVPSQKEGFGLPVVEATMRGCPVITRDIPVLREVAGESATYFSSFEPLDDVIARVVNGQLIPQVSDTPLLSWRHVGERLLAVLDGRNVEPLARWVPENGWSWQYPQKGESPK